MPPKGKSKAQTAPRPAEKPRDAVPQSASQPSTSGAVISADPMLIEYPRVDALMLKVRSQVANSEIHSGALAAMGWLEEFSSKLEKIRENPMDEDVVLPPPTTARKTATRKTAVRKTTTRKTAAERADAAPSGTKRRTRAARKLAEETQDIIVTEEIQIVEVVQTVSEAILVVEKNEEVREEEVKPVPAKRRTTKKKSSAVKQSPKFEAIEIPPESISEPSFVEAPVVDEKPEEGPEAIVAEEHPLEPIEERPTAEGQASTQQAQPEEQAEDGDVSMRLITPEPAEKPVEEAVQTGTQELSDKVPMEVEQVSGEEVKPKEEQKVEPVSAEVEDEWVEEEEEKPEDKANTTDLLEAFAVQEGKTAPQEEARPVEERKRQKEPTSKESREKVPVVANEERNRAAVQERMRAREAERARKAAEKREELERARQAKVEAQVLEKGKHEVSKKPKVELTKQRHLDAEKRRQDEMERYKKLAAKNILTEGSSSSPVRQTHYSGMKAASATKASTPSKPSTLSLGDVQKTPPKVPSWQSATATSTSKQNSQSFSQLPTKGFKQVSTVSKIFTPLQLPRVNVGGLRVAQSHVSDRVGSSQKTAVPVIPSLDSLRTNLTDSQQKASQPIASTSGTSKSSVEGGDSPDSQRDRAMSPLMGVVKKPASGVLNVEKPKEAEPESDSLVRQTASMSLKEKDDTEMVDAPRPDQKSVEVAKVKDQVTEEEKDKAVEKSEEKIEKEEKVVKQPSLPVAAARHKLKSTNIVNDGSKKDQENASTVTAANSTYIHLPRSADRSVLTNPTADLQSKKPSVEITGSTFPTSAFEAAKSVFNKVAHPFSAFQSQPHVDKPSSTFPVLPQDTSKDKEKPSNNNPFSTFKPGNFPQPVVSKPSHLETLKSANPFSASTHSETLESTANNGFPACSHLQKPALNIQSGHLVTVSSLADVSQPKAPQPFSTFHKEPLSTPSSNGSSTAFSTGSAVATVVKADKHQQLPTTSHKAPTTADAPSSKPAHKHNSKKRPVEETETYGLDIHQDDDTDDEDNPRKVVPKWAESAHLSALMRQQLFREIDLDFTFEGARPSAKVALGDIFHVPEARYNKRTSSQMWTHPPLALGIQTPLGHLKHVREGIENNEDV